jgi:hypothetical protein
MILRICRLAFAAASSLVIVPIFVRAQDIVAGSEGHGDHWARPFGQGFELREQRGDLSRFRVVSCGLIALDKLLALNGCSSIIWKVEKMAATTVNLPIFNGLPAIWAIAGIRLHFQTPACVCFLLPSSDNARGSGGEQERVYCGRDSKPRLRSASKPLFPPPILPPAPVQPQPLLRVLAHPGLHHGGDRLHGAGDLDAAFGIAHRADAD